MIFNEQSNPPSLPTPTIESIKKQVDELEITSQHKSTLKQCIDELQQPANAERAASKFQKFAKEAGIRVYETLKPLLLEVAEDVISDAIKKLL